MNADRWKLVETLYERASGLPAADRRSFLAGACSGDQGLISELESLLRHSSAAKNYLDTPAIQHLAGAIAADETWVDPADLSGKTLSHYQVHEAIGRGGMGVVYKAGDLKLGRAVALKLLPDYLLRDPQALQRFEREARAASALNHPNICTVYEIDRAEDQPFIAIEYLEGESLRDRIGRGPLDITETLRIASEVCQALEAAHSSGIVHRDVKPANIFLTQRGITKVLDFGAAKRVGSDASDLNPESSISPPAGFAEQLLTLPGSALGTVEYMSPEQAKGQPADPRADIYSLGTVICEMATGKLPPRTRASPRDHDTLSARMPAAMDTLGPEVPPRLAKIVSRALAVDPAQRYQHVSELRAELEALQHKLTGAAGRRRTLLITLAVVMVITAVAVDAIREHFRGTSTSVAAPRSAARSISSLAVLPFRDLNSDPAGAVYADGMTAALIYDLAKLRSIRIVSSNSSGLYKGTDKRVRDVARALSVNALIEGTVTHSGGRIQASVQLVDGASEQSLWHATYERGTQDVLLLQRQMAVAIARELKGTLSARDQTALTARVQTVNPAAYEAYLRGNYFHESGAFDKADEFYRKAIDLDPSFEAPYTGSAENLAIQAYAGLLPPAQTWMRAEALLAKALALDPASALAHTFVGMIALQFRCDRSAAEKELNRALELSPGNLDVLDYHSYFLMEIGHSSEGIAEKKGILESDPLSIGTGEDLGLYLVLAGRYDEAIEQLKKILELDPMNSTALARLGLAYSSKGEYARAVEEFKRSLAIERIPPILGNLGYTYARWQKTEDALRVASQLIQMSKHRYISPALIARIYAALGDKARALAWLERSALGDRPYVNDAGFDSLRSNPRFKAMSTRLRPSDYCPLM